MLLSRAFGNLHFVSGHRSEYPRLLRSYRRRRDAKGAPSQSLRRRGGSSQPDCWRKRLRAELELRGLKSSWTISAEDRLTNRPGVGARRQPSGLSLTPLPLGDVDVAGARSVTSRHVLRVAGCLLRRLETCDTLHAHTQVLGKLAVALAPPEPQLQHAALRLTARGWETAPLPAPDDSGALVVALDLRTHEAIVEHSDGREQRVPLAPDRPVGQVTRALLGALDSLAGAIEIDPTPQEVPWTVALDEDEEHTRYEPHQVASYFAAATRAALVLAAFRAPYRGRSTPVNAWWGSFDLAVNLFSGLPANPPSDDFIMRNAMDAQEFAIGWWPGDPRYGHAAFYAYVHPPAEGFATGSLEPSTARWEEDLGEYILDWDDVRRSPDPHAVGLEFARDVFRHACVVCAWDPKLPASAEGMPPPVA